MQDNSYRLDEQEPTVRAASGQDLATILSQLPRSGVEDDVTRLMEIYEAGERSYRASVQASLQSVKSSASTSL